MKRKFTPPEIPDKLYFPIREAAKITGVEAYVLRFWEKEFPSLSPAKESTGHRRYRRKDIELILCIKSLLYDQGFTIPGARTRLKKFSSTPLLFTTEDLAPAQPVRSTISDKKVQTVLRTVRRGLNEILTLLNQS
jgi:DNA-binding transcriptional MerR regulator